MYIMYRYGAVVLTHCGVTWMLPNRRFSKLRKWYLIWEHPPPCLYYTTPTPSRHRRLNYNVTTASSAPQDDARSLAARFTPGTRKWLARGLDINIKIYLDSTYCTAVYTLYMYVCTLYKIYWRSLLCSIHLYVFIFFCFWGSRVSDPEPEPPRAGVFGWSRSRHFGPDPASAPP